MADTFLEHQIDFASYTASELASRAGVSRATAARLIRSLGYKTFYEAKRQVRSQRNWGSPLQALDRPGQPGNGIEAIKVFVDSDVTNIKRTIDRIPPESIMQSVRWLHDSKRVWLLGLRSGFGIAYHARHLLQMVKEDVRMIMDLSMSVADELASIRKNDTVILVVFRRAPRTLNKIVSALKYCGARVIVVTDISTQFPEMEEMVTLRCRCHSPGLFDSHISAACLLGAIVSALGTSLEDQNKKHLEHVEQLHALVDDLLVPRPERGTRYPGSGKSET